MTDRILELERILDTVCNEHDTDCKSCPYSKECDEYQQLSIEYATIY